MKAMDTEKKICSENLFSVTESAYGPLYKEHALEQYKAYLQSINYTSKLKHTVNNYFLAINTLLVSAVGLSVARTDFFDPGVWHRIIPIAGIFLCLAWWYSTREYKSVNRVKFKILRCLEGQLPFALHTTEEKIILDESAPPYGYPSETIEPVVPWVFSVLYVLIFFFIS